MNKSIRYALDIKELFMEESQNTVQNRIFVFILCELFNMIYYKALKDYCQEKNIEILKYFNR